jgi:hypothetical protein
LADYRLEQQFLSADIPLLPAGSRLPWTCL